MSNSEIIAMLNEDLKGEHMAIVQYLRHAYAMGEGEMACEIEAISREEMRHFDWLAELIVDLGGKPSLNRASFTGIADDVVQNMRFDVQAEDGAIALYRQHLEAIQDTKIRRLLSRILSDEESHKGDFEHFVEKAGRETAPGAGTDGAPQTAPVAKPAAPGHPSAKRVQDMLDYGIRHEYSVILQYLYHSYFMPDCDIGNELEIQAINEMQHLGWLSEEMEGIGGTPEIEHLELVIDGSPADMLRADIAVEREVTVEYSQQIPEIDDPGLKDLITRIRDHEIYHADLFEDLLDEVKDADKPAPAEPEVHAPAQESRTPPTVGSLFGKKQS